MKGDRIMKKIPLLLILTLALGLFFVTSQALASPATAGPKKTPGPPLTPGPQNTPGAQAILHAANQDCRGRHQNYRGTIASTSPLQLTLRDGIPSPTFTVTSDTRMKFPGPNGSTATLQVGMQAMVQAVADQNGNLTACAVMVIPGQPTRVHRVGWVTAYNFTPGVGGSITIQASDGQSYTFTLTGDTKILPQDRAGELGSGSRVTVIARRDPSLGWTAFGIVVHPEGSGAGSMPPTATATPDRKS